VSTDISLKEYARIKRAAATDLNPLYNWLN